MTDTQQTQPTAEPIELQRQTQADVISAVLAFNTDETTPFTIEQAGVWSGQIDPPKGVVIRMFEAGWLTREQADGKGRAWVYTLTAAGRVEAERSLAERDARLSAKGAV